MKKNNKDKIINACLDLFMEHGDTNVSTKMILEAAEVSNGTLFYYFPTKDDIILAIYYSIKDEISKALKEDVNTDLLTRPFLFDYWKSTISWGLDNARKKAFVYNYGNSVLIQNHPDDLQEERYGFITSRIQQAIHAKEIVSPNLLFFNHHFRGARDAIINYLNDVPDDNTPEFIEAQFDQYWRSVVKY